VNDAPPPLLLRPIHGWFFLWEDIIPSLYRVLAVAAASVITAGALVLTVRINWFIAGATATIVWIVLAVIQEHDERVVLDVDAEFLKLLLDQADPVLAEAGFVYRNASGPQRAQKARADTFLYEVPGDGYRRDCIDLWIHRDRFPGGSIEVTVDSRPLERLLVSQDEPELAERVTRTEDAAGDVAAIVTALELVLSTEDE
jgi:hypothetical protein